MNVSKLHLSLCGLSRFLLSLRTTEAFLLYPYLKCIFENWYKQNAKKLLQSDY